MLRLFEVVFLCLLSVVVHAEIQEYCLKQLPSRLFLEKDVPQNMQFLSDYKQLINYEVLNDGKGWGYSLKYQNAYCEVIIYIYNRQKSTITDSDVDDELLYFDGFVPSGQFSKNVGTEVFKGYAGMAIVDEKIGQQTQMVSLAQTENQFVKYRTSCRKMSDLSEAANYRMADQFTTNVIKGTYAKLSECLKKTN